MDQQNSDGQARYRQPEPDRNCCEALEHNRAQTNSIATGVLLMIIGGIHMAWAIWRLFFSLFYDAWFVHATFSLLIFTLTSWWVAGIFGLIVGAASANVTKKKSFYFAGGGFLLVSSVISIAADQYFEAIIIARLLAGFGHGLVYVPLLCQASENAANDFRGRTVAFVNFGILLGMFLFTLCNYIAIHSSSTQIRTDRLIGMFSIVIIVLAMFLNYFLTYESVPYLLQHDREDKALLNMTTLRQEAEHSFQIQNDFHEMKQMVEEDSSEDPNIFTDGNHSPLLIILGLRVLAFSTNNYILNLIQLTLSWANVAPSPAQVAAMYLTGIRFVCSIIALFVSDLFPRKAVLLFSLITSGIFLLIIGILLNITINQSVLYALAACFAIFQLAASCGIDPSQEIILSEAFTLGKKAWSIMFVTGIEYLMQLLAIVIFMNVGLIPAVQSSMAFISVGIFLIVGIPVYIYLPETSNLSLYRTRVEFNSEKQSSE